MLKIEFLLENVPTSHAVRVGETVNLQPSSSGRLECTYSDGSVLGNVPETVAQDLPEENFFATVRSVKRKEGELFQVQIRVTSGAAPQVHLKKGERSFCGKLLLYSMFQCQLLVFLRLLECLRL